MSAKYAEIRIGPSQVAVAADTERDWYVQFTQPGKWIIKAVRLMPMDAVTAHGTNYCTLTLTNATQSQTIGARSYAATDSVAGTPETVTTPTGLAGVVTQYDVLKLAKLDPASGLAFRGEFVVSLEQAPLP
jgi:hypothetical protein